jgi:ketosteroid isomerase-like protein
MTRYILASIMLASAAAGAAHPLLVAGTVVPGVPTPETEVRSVLGFWDRARARHDAAVLARITAVDFAATTADGAALTRSALLAGAAPEAGARMILRDDLAVRIDGDAATATARLTRIGTPRGPETADVTLETVALRRSGDSWLIVSVEAKRP